MILFQRKLLERGMNIGQPKMAVLRFAEDVLLQSMVILSFGGS
jgi:hypothetical protein